MNGNIKIIFADKGIRYPLFFSLILLFLQCIVAAIAFFKLPPVIPLFNSLSWGNQRLASTPFLVGVPLFLTCIAILNILLLNGFYKKYALLSRMLAVNLLLIIVLSSIAIAQIFFLAF